MKKQRKARNAIPCGLWCLQFCLCGIRELASATCQTSARVGVTGSFEVEHTKSTVSADLSLRDLTGMYWNSANTTQMVAWKRVPVWNRKDLNTKFSELKDLCLWRFQRNMRQEAGSQTAWEKEKLFKLFWLLQLQPRLRWKYRIWSCQHAASLFVFII